MTGARVSSTVNSFIAVPPQHAYDAVIREAAAIYSVDAALIRSVVQAESAFDSMALTLAGYNAGSGIVAKYGGRVPPFKETKNYVKRITSLIADARNSGND